MLGCLRRAVLPAPGGAPIILTRFIPTISEMSIQIKLFANLADSIGKRSGTLERVQGMTVRSLWQEFSGQEEIPEGVLCAVNFDYAEPEQKLDDGDEIAFFPPVTGG